MRTWNVMIGFPRSDFYLYLPGDFIGMDWGGTTLVYNANSLGV
jgi:hypothetical protein